ncbi:MAG: hypothetical protein WCG44_03690 [bacterium]
MEKPFDSILNRMSRNQLVVLRYMLGRPDSVVPSREIARKTGIVEKQLGGVLSALSRKLVGNEHLVDVMGRDGTFGLRYRLNSKAITLALAEKQVRSLLLSYK